jgi:hypothetical protein
MKGYLGLRSECCGRFGCVSLAGATVDKGFYTETI